MHRCCTFFSDPIIISNGKIGKIQAHHLSVCCHTGFVAVVIQTDRRTALERKIKGREQAVRIGPVMHTFPFFWAIDG